MEASFMQKSIILFSLGWRSTKDQNRHHFIGIDINVSSLSLLYAHRNCQVDDRHTLFCQTRVLTKLHPFSGNNFRECRILYLQSELFIAENISVRVISWEMSHNMNSPWMFVEIGSTTQETIILGSLSKQYFVKQLNLHLHFCYSQKYYLCLR